MNSCGRRSRVSDEQKIAPDPPAADIGEFCRHVEACLSRANDGHLVRIVGVGFDLVRSWALEGIPLSVVCRGIEMKNERHRAGASRRPLRIEFCEGDVRALYDSWRRAVGLHAAVSAIPDAPAAAARGAPAAVARQASRPRHRTAGSRVGTHRVAGAAARRRLESRSRRRRPYARRTCSRPRRGA